MFELIVLEQNPVESAAIDKVYLHDLHIVDKVTSPSCFTHYYFSFYVEVSVLKHISIASYDHTLCFYVTKQTRSLLQYSVFEVAQN